MSRYSIIIYYYLYALLTVVTITRPPENETVNIGSDVTISCGYQRATALPVIWIINGTSFTQQEVVDSPLYQLNNPTSPSTFSLTVFSINHTTTFQCLVHSTLSTLGTVNVITGMYIHYVVSVCDMLAMGSLM